MVGKSSMKTVYNELRELRKDVNKMKLAPIPEEKLSGNELKEIKRIVASMEKGKRKSFSEIFG